MKLKPIEHGIKSMQLPCGKIADLNDDLSYSCRHCRAVIGSTDEPSDCKSKREKAEPLKGDWWMFADEENDDQKN
jgi:hypothetical protein